MPAASQTVAMKLSQSIVRETMRSAVVHGRRRPIDPVMALTTEQCELLGALLDHDTSPLERTTAALARQANLSPRQVAAWLGELEARSPSLVRRVYDEPSQVQAWTPTDAARDAHERWCRA